MMEIDLQGKVALVTGASRGIGRAIAAALTGAGANVAIGYRSNRSGAEAAADQCGPRSLLVQGNVADPLRCKEILGKVIARYGRIDILVNNAGIAEKDSVAMDFDTWINHWRKTLDTNFLSAVHLSYLCLQQMIRQRGGKIINVSSRSAFRGETEYLAYAASKAAMVNFTRCLARTFATRNILAYAVAPGFIETDMATEELEHRGEEIRAQIPSGKVGLPDDVAHVVLFLASDLSNYITGSTIDVNGGSYLH
jgi:3-oxoacyl-[acyl-carrier protein] reductase